MFYFCESFLWCSTGHCTPECVNHSKIRLLADNCIVYRCIHNQQDAKLLQEDINAIQTWTSIWQMNFNISKCCLIHFTQATTHKMENTYYLHNTLLLSSDRFKHLGVTLQFNWTHDRHVQDITAKADCALGLLRRNVRTSSPQLKECAYKALVRPQLEYVSTVYMVSLANIPCGCYWESPVLICLLHI